MDSNRGIALLRFDWAHSNNMALGHTKTRKQHKLKNATFTINDYRFLWYLVYETIK